MSLAYHTVEDGPWPYGVTVSVWSTAGLVEGLPVGMPIDAAVAHIDGTVTFGGLIEGGDYTAFGSGGSQQFIADNINNQGFRLPTIDLREFVGAEADLLGLDNEVSGLMTTSWETANSQGKALLLPARTMYVNGPCRIPERGAELVGRGRDVSILKSHPDYATSGPILAPPTAGSSVPIYDLRLRDFTLDGDYQNSTGFTTQATLTVDAAADVTTYTVDSTAGFPATAGAGAMTLRWGINGDGGGDPHQAFYTSLDATHFYGVTHAYGVAQTAGDIVRWYPGSGLGLFRIYAIDGLTMLRVSIRRGGGYGMALQGYSTNGRGPERNIWVQECLFEDNNSDGVDMKHVEKAFFVRSRFLRNQDTGLDPRASQATVINCYAAGNNTGFNFDAHRATVVPGGGAVPGDGTAKLAVACTKTDTSLTFDNATPLPNAGTGHLQAEQISWTGKAGNTITGVLRGLDGTRAAPHAADSPNIPSWLAFDIDPEDPLYNVDPKFQDLHFSVDMYGCVTEDNIASGVVINCSGWTNNLSATIVGGENRRNGHAGLQLIGGQSGVLDAVVTGGHNNDNGGDGIWARSVRRLNMSGLQAHGNQGGGDSPGDGVILENCSNGGLVEVNATGNVGRPVRLKGNSDFFTIDGIAHGNFNDLPVEVAGFNHNRGGLFATGRSFQGRSMVLMPQTDGGPTPTVPVLFDNSPAGRREIQSGAIAASTSGTLELWSVWLPGGLVITRPGMQMGATAVASATHQFFTIYDSAFGLLIQTPDIGTNNWSASVGFDRPFNTPPTTYTVPDDGLYYIGFCAVAATMPTYGGTPSIATGATPWLRIVTSNTGLTGTAPATAVPLSEGAGVPYIYFK